MPREKNSLLVSNPCFSDMGRRICLEAKNSIRLPEESAGNKVGRDLDGEGFRGY